jgi:hypothetical protein
LSPLRAQPVRLPPLRTAPFARQTSLASP